MPLNSPGQHVPIAQRGWYCVYLFHARGAGVFLALIHGSTTFEGGEFRPRPPEELQRLVAWGREVLAGAVAQNPGLAQPVDVRGRELASAYERSIPISRWYPAGALPSDATLFADLLEFATYLRQLHDAERLGQMPMTAPPEIVEVERVAAGPSVPGQGFGLTAAEKRAVELRAMTLARAHLEELGWYVRNTSTNHPYDFECLREDVKMIVEVKGTTSRGESVVLTRNEVAAHRKHHPHNALIVVHSIVLRAGGGVPSAEGGFLVMQSPWTIEDGALRPIAYEYNVTAA